MLDHSPNLLNNGKVRRDSTPFRFESMWLKEEVSKNLLKRWWLGIILEDLIVSFLLQN